MSYQGACCYQALVSGRNGDHGLESQYFRPIFELIIINSYYLYYINAMNKVKVLSLGPFIKAHNLQSVALW